MGRRFLTSIGALAVVIALLQLASVSFVSSTSLENFVAIAEASREGAQPQPATPKTETAADPAPKTPWGDPDLQGIWTDEYQTPLQRPAQYAGKEFFTDAEIAALDKKRAAILRQDHRETRGSERDVSGAYNAVFVSVKPTGRRTSLVVDPPDGRIPPYTPEAKTRMDAGVRA